MPFVSVHLYGGHGRNGKQYSTLTIYYIYFLGDNMQDIEKKYRGYVYILGRDDYADDPTRPFNSYVYKDGELLDGGGDFETMEEAEDMAKSTIDGYMEALK